MILDQGSTRNWKHNRDCGIARGTAHADRLDNGNDIDVASGKRRAPLLWRIATYIA
jgi:hypothetical protein